MRYQQHHSPPPWLIPRQNERDLIPHHSTASNFIAACVPMARKPFQNLFPNHEQCHRTIATSVDVNSPAKRYPGTLVCALSRQLLRYLNLRVSPLPRQSSSALPPMRPDQSTCNVGYKTDVKDCQSDIPRKRHIADIAPALPS